MDLSISWLLFFYTLYYDMFKFSSFKSCCCFIYLLNFCFALVLQALSDFMHQVMGGSVKFDPSNMVLTAGATPAIEILSFCLADHGNAFLVPTPYYPG